MNKTIAVVFGGKSAEHEVSIITAHIPIIQALEATGQYDIWPIYISKDGSWYSNKLFNTLDFFKQPNWEDRLIQEKKIYISFDNGFFIIWPGLRSRSQKIDVVFPAMHGTFGEDGSLMGLLRMAHVPFVGCDVFASAVAMDKVLSKQVLDAEKIPVVPYVWFTRHDWEKDKQSQLEKITTLSYPLFVKPVHLGSSIGISKVIEKGALENAIDVALHYDDKILVEEAVENLIEVTLPLLGDETVELGEIERPLNKSEFFDFNDKYMSGGKSNSGVNSPYSEIPANISVELSNRVKDLGIKTYKTLGCTGIARVDFLIDAKENSVYVNEINTLPGSLYHHNWRAKGVSSVDLVQKLIYLAEERFKKQNQTTFTFNSDILKKAGGVKNGQLR